MAAYGLAGSALGSRRIDPLCAEMRDKLLGYSVIGSAV